MSWLELIEQAVHRFDSFLKVSAWRGRENEIVNLFAHRFLLESAKPDSPLRSVRQIGIEVAVRQVAGIKKLVRKDLVLWPREDMTVWMDDGTPAVIMEWKANKPADCERDSRWLAQFCAKHPGTLGIAACANMLGPERHCRIIAIHGATQSDRQ